MARTFNLPDLGEGVHEGEVKAVLVSVGQQIKEGDIILVVETDKAAVEIPSPFTGKITQIQVLVGDVVKVGDVMIVFDDEEGQLPAKAPAMEQIPRPEAVIPPGELPPTAPVPASPATRRLARQLGVDLRKVTPTGRSGVVTADDVQAFAAKDRPSPAAQDAPDTGPVEPSRMASPVEEQPAAAQPTRPELMEPGLPDFSRWGEIERVALRSIRRATAKQMNIAWASIPHVNSQDVVDVTALEAFRRSRQTAIEAAGGRLTLTVFVVKAVAAALKAFPRFNASLDWDAQEIILKHYYHIGVAVNTDDGLIVPVIREVDRKSIKELATEIHDCVQRTRTRKIRREELIGGTFTITNAGAMGGGFFTPIINYPQVAILGLGQARMQAAVVTEPDGGHSIVPRLLMPIVLCIDHRVLDGADAIMFLRMVIDALEDPEELLMTMT
jgi:pyruvate dehydrogenase E2 component (dihydrolipoamide acetyltransferase)